MTDYNDGKWHGWNGGECPVHPETVVSVALDDRSPVHNETAEQWFWDAEGTHIITFRVVKEYREPREGWELLGHMFESYERADKLRVELHENHPSSGFLSHPITHWREVIE